MKSAKRNPDLDQLGRRRFLRQTLCGSVALSAASWMPRLDPRDKNQTQRADQLRFFSEDEYLIVSAAGARLTGHSPGEANLENSINVALRADQFLSTEDPEIQDQIHLLLTIFNSALAAFFFSFKFSSFLAMDPADQNSYLEGWMTSSIGFRRTGFQALKRLCMSMHYTDRRSWDEIGYQGMFLPGERP